jgi:hypothetical protein
MKTVENKALMGIYRKDLTLSVGQEIAIKSAQNYRFLRKNGVTVRKTIDVIIGTFCIHSQISLLHDDRDFDPMEKFLKLKTIKT